uniref:Cytochrome P450 n=1 Tax=Alexandrium andersonii TaxID=327968 RepID=A0A7S2CUF0_9DINO
MAARRELVVILRKLMDNPNLEKQNIIRDLAQASEEGEALNLDEMVDTVVTLLMAGKVTTADALPEMVVQLSEHRDWAERIAEEPLEFNSIEEDSATLRVVRECLRIRPPVGAYRRVSQEPIDLGEHGRLPAGTPFAVLIGPALKNMSEEYNPDRWTPEVTRSDFLAFGGSQPHACIGRHLALLELQVFARVLCREYDFEAVQPELEVNKKYLLSKTYKDGLRVKITKRVTS